MSRVCAASCRVLTLMQLQAGLATSAGCGRIPHRRPQESGGQRCAVAAPDLPLPAAPTSVILSIPCSGPGGVNELASIDLKQITSSPPSGGRGAGGTSDAPCSALSRPGQPQSP